MVARENVVILLFATLALALAYGGRLLTGLSDSVLVGVLLFTGVVVPQLLNSYLDGRETA